MKEILQELDKLSTQRPLQLIQSKKEGKKIVEYFGDYVPEQWITAAGAMSYPIFKGGDAQPQEATLDYSLRFMNPLAATMAGAYLMGIDPVMPIADSITVQQHDCHYGRMCDILEYKGLPVFKIGVPGDYTSSVSQAYYRSELKDFRVMLEELTGGPISDDAIRANYKKTNQIHEWLRKIATLRKKDNPPITFSDFIKLNHYTYLTDYDTSIKALETIYQKLVDAPGAHKEGAPRILIMGRAVAYGDYIAPGIVESSGGAIVCEFLDEAIRPFQTDLSLDGDVLDAYAAAMYDKRVPLSNFQPAWDTRFAHLKDLIQEYRVDGVLWYQLSFDEIYDMEFTCLSKWLNELRIPVLKLETSYEYSREAMAPLTTRLESFVESLKEAK